MMYKAIVFLPDHRRADRRLCSAARSGPRPSEIITTLFVGISAALSWVVFTQVGFGGGDRARAGAALGDVGRARRVVGAAHRHADRRDAGGGEHRVVPRAPLFHRLHARGRQPAALLRLPVAVHVRHADAGDQQQLPAAVLRLGRRGPRLLSADRLLVPEARGQRGGHQGVRGQPGGRLRLRARHLRHLRRVRHDQLRRGVHAPRLDVPASRWSSWATSGIR